MMTEKIRIRFANEDDCVQIHSIYSFYVRNTAISFEYDVPSPEEMKERMRVIKIKYPYLVAESNRIILGYAYASDFRYRSAYQWSPESTVYLDSEFRGNGIGFILYNKLFAILRLQGFYNVFGGVALPNPASEKLHLKCGFENIGVYKNIGYKQEKWHSTQWFQLILAPHPLNPKPPLKPEEISKEELAKIFDSTKP